MSERIIDPATAAREQNLAAGLEVADLDPDPLRQFASWLADAEAAELWQPHAMVLATAAADARPSARTVILRGFDADGFVFYTSYDSRKGNQLTANPVAALVFPWHTIERQVLVDGTVERVSEAESDAFFATRHRDSQLGAWASPQSQVISSRAELDAQFEAAAARFTDEVPRPEDWGGLRLRPAQYEFWQGRHNRLHDRFRYRPAGDGWAIERLAP